MTNILDINIEKVNQCYHDNFYLRLLIKIHSPEIANNRKHKKLRVIYFTFGTFDEQ